MYSPFMNMKDGDEVILKSGGAKMTLGYTYKGADDRLCAMCYWFEGSTVRQEEFPVTVLAQWGQEQGEIAPSLGLSQLITVQEVIEQVESISECADDAESAHGLEDALYKAVLTAVAEGAPNAAELAREALKTKELKFPRYTA